MLTILTAVAVNVVSIVIGNYIYDKWFKKR